MLRKPILALRRDPSRRARENDICGDPAKWFDFPTFQEHKLYAASFDFFVDWQRERVCDEVWIKRISDSDDILHLEEEALIDLIADCDGRETCRRLYLFLARQKFAEKYMLFRDVPQERWESGEEKVVELDLSRYRRGSVSYYTAREIEDKIKALRKTPVPIGRAGLIYATSVLEGYLSERSYFWPGDVDTLLYDNYGGVKAVLEFKKHTASSRIAFQDQKITNYLERDIMKYKSLALLRDRFSTSLYVVYYPIPRDIRYIIVEKLEGAPDALYASERWEMALPVQRNFRSMQAFAERFLADVLHLPA